MLVEPRAQRGDVRDQAARSARPESVTSRVAGRVGREGPQAAGAAEPVPRAVVVQVQRRSRRSATVIPHTGSIAVPVCSAAVRRSAARVVDRRGRRAGAARRRSRRGSTARPPPAVRAPMSSPAGVCTRAAARPRPRRGERDHGLAALAAGDQADVGHPGAAAPRVEHLLLVPAVRGDHDGGRLGAVRGVRRRRRDLVAEPLAERGEGAARSGSRRAPTSSGAGTTGSRKISSVPPDRQGLCTVSAPSARAPSCSLRRRA